MTPLVEQLGVLLLMLAIMYAVVDDGQRAAAARGVRPVLLRPISALTTTPEER